MLKFAICDDLTTEANTLKNHIERYAREKSLRVEIDAYSEAQAILAVLARIAEYDLVFLNIYMERLNGIDLARWLREQGDKSRIIFFSTSKRARAGRLRRQRLRLSDHLRMALPRRLRSDRGVCPKAGSQRIDFRYKSCAAGKARYTIRNNGAPFRCAVEKYIGFTPSISFAQF